MNSLEKNARIVWRTKSVEVTRVMPSRCAASVASVDFPVPVAPPTSSDDRQIELLERLPAAQPAHRLLAVRLAEHLDGELGEPVEIEPRAPALARGRPPRAGPARTRASSATPVAISARAIRPFENGSPSSPPSGSGAR